MGQDISQPMSAEMRARLVADAIGKISDGDPRERVYQAALSHIRCSVAVATGSYQQSLRSGSE